MKSFSTSDFKALAKLWPWLARSKMHIMIAAMMIPIAAVLETMTPIAVQRTIDLGVMTKDMNAVFYWSSIYLGLVLMSYIFRIAQSITMATAVHR
ncbi:MAG: hypothetical protein NTV34_14445, partial [Proteobacteria bacterium]|nr:hypothetical protein [Pseudomonadota bacterium]